MSAKEQTSKYYNTLLKNKFGDFADGEYNIYTMKEYQRIYVKMLYNYCKEHDKEKYDQKRLYFKERYQAKKDEVKNEGWRIRKKNQPPLKIEELDDDMFYTLD